MFIRFQWLIEAGRPQLLALAALAAVAAAGPSAQAQDYKSYNVSTVRYENHGAYTACIHIDWKNANGTHRRSYAPHCIATGESTTWPLAHVDDEGGHKIAEGEEIWGFVIITLGDAEKCRKDGTKFFYDPNGGKVTYKTGGTTLNKNRCKIVDTP